jgi:hypothetical protein
MSRRRLSISLALSVVGAVAVAEVLLRAIWGLGTPILVEWDARYEYRMAPNQSIRRFGQRIETNALGLRSRDFEPHKRDPNELRVLVVGDSVMQGGSHVDQELLATTILERELHKRLKRPVLVINASANSWGPANQLAFLEAEGTFDADIAVVVLSSHDLVDLPSNMALARERDGQVMNRPWSAITEVLGMVWARVVPGGMAPAPDDDDERLREPGERELRALLNHLLNRTGKPLVVLHWDRDEQKRGRRRSALDRITSVSSGLGIPVHDTGPALVSEGTQPGGSPMVDLIHPSATGQRLLAEEMLRAVESVLGGDTVDGVSPVQ